MKLNRNTTILILEPTYSWNQSLVIDELRLVFRLRSLRVLHILNNI